MIKTRLIALTACTFLWLHAQSQHVVWPSESIVELTAEWTGERTPGWKTEGLRSAIGKTEGTLHGGSLGITGSQGLS